jgi:hypothetical protein
MSDLMRKEFEVWAESRGMDLYCSRKNIYVESETLWAWSSWKASRECLVIELPKPYVWDNDGGFERESDPDSECSMALIPKIDAMQSIHAAGVKTK